MCKLYQYRLIKKRINSIIHLKKATKSLAILFLLLHSWLILTSNPISSSCIASLDTLEITYTLFLKTGFARIRDILQSLIIKDLRGIFKEKFRENRAIGGESKVLPHLIQKGFEGGRGSLPLDSYSEVKMPLKASRDEGLRGMDINLGVERRKPQECSVDESWD